MDPLPPADLGPTPPAPPARGWVDRVLDSRGVGVVFSLVLFGISFVGNTWQREQQRVEMKRQAEESERMREQMRRQADDISVIRAILEQQRRK